MVCTATLALAALTVLLRRRGGMGTVAALLTVMAFGVFLIVNSEMRGRVATVNLPGMERVESVIYEQRERLAEMYRQQGLADDEYAVVAAMTLGDRSGVSRELKDAYRMSGAAHVFAVSGLHMGIIWAIMAFVLPTRVFPRLSSLLMIVVIWMYAMLVGMHASVMRAAMMLTIYTMCNMVARERDALSALLLTAFLLLTFNPQWLYDVGFQMSFLATLSIVVLMVRTGPKHKRYRIIQERGIWKRMMRWWPVKWLLGVMGASIAAQMAVAPLVAYYFGNVSVYFLLTNIVVSPAAMLIISMCMVLWVLCYICGAIPVVSVLMGWVSKVLIYVVRGLNDFLIWVSELPGAAVRDIHLSLSQVLVIYVALICVVLIVRIIKK